MKVLAPSLAALGLLAGAAFTTPVFSATHSSFLDYCQNPGTSKAGKITLKAISESAKSSDCAKMEGYLKKEKHVYLKGDNLTDVTALSFFSNFEHITLVSKKDIDLSKMGASTGAKSISVDAPISKFAFTSSNLESIDIANAPNVILEGFEKHVNVDLFILFNAATPSFAEINKLKKLKILDLAWSNLSKVSQIDKLVNLEILHVPYNDLVDISGIDKLSKLENITISGNHVTDLSPLAKLTELEYLDISHNPARDFSPLYGLKNLTGLALDSLEVSDLSQLAQFKTLDTISLRNNEITDLSPLAKLTRLTDVDLANNLIRDLSPLGGLENLRWVNAASNYINQIPKLTDVLHGVDLANNLITSLENLDVDDGSDLSYLQLDHNAIQSLKGIEVLGSLKNLFIEGNKIHSLSSLSSLEQLELLFAKDNRIYDLSGIANLPNLESVSLSNNRVTSLAPLKDTAIKWLRFDNNPLGYEFKRYPSTCPTKAASTGVARWCSRPIERRRMGGWISTDQAIEKSYVRSAKSAILGL